MSVCNFDASYYLTGLVHFAFSSPCCSQAELKEGGADCPVTNANKLEYIALIIKWRFLGRVEKQVRFVYTTDHGFFAMYYFIK